MLRAYGAEPQRDICRHRKKQRLTSWSGEDCLSPTVAPVGASSTAAQDGKLWFLPRGEAVTRFLLLFGDAKRSDLVLGHTRTSGYPLPYPVKITKNNPQIILLYSATPDVY
jgi:hypothetical protein